MVEDSPPYEPPLADPEEFYDDLGYDEWERLERTFSNRMEFENTVAYLERDLPESGRVVDVGGGAGRYTVWLAERGYEVVLVDPSDRQREIAREQVRERDLVDRVTVEEGDARDLDYPDASFDAVLCLGGPLSHLLDEDDRRRALEELQRVARPDAPTFVSVMGRLAVLLNLARREPDLYPALPHLAETGDHGPEAVEEFTPDYDGPRFTHCHFFRADELADALAEAGFRVENVVGLEGVATNLDEDDPVETEATDEQREHLREVVEDLREDPAVADLSNHILAVARA